MKNAPLLFLLCAASCTYADERILNYHSEILVKSTSWIEVTETIQVQAEGQQIRRGIYRDYPTEYEDRFGNKLQVVYEPRSVLRNDRREEFFSESFGNGVRTYFGSSDRMLDHGVHTYSYRYDANRMLGFFDERDELYWNVTGNGWEFPIDNATATVSFDFPVSGDELRVEAYSGAYGAIATNYRAETTESGQANFETTVPLAAGSGLTIVVGWPKGLVSEPGQSQKLMWLLTDNANLLVAVAGLLTMLVYYIPVWRKFGKDPAAGSIFPRYVPPDGYSPASLRYIERMSYDDKNMTSAIINLAVKGYLNISEVDDGHTLTRRDGRQPAQEVAAGEQALLDALFVDGNSLIVGKKYQAQIKRARSAHQRSLRRDYASRYFKTNGLLNLPAALVAIVATIVALSIGFGPTLFVGVAVAAMFVTLIGFAFVMKQPTGLGRKIMDETAGFREFLEIAEKDEMNLRNPPDKTPELFEKYLPFAMAMGVEQEWADRFTRVFAKLQGSDGSAYRPAWYSGNWNNISLGSSTSNLSKGLSRAISTSATPPGSSSGSGGGGFSGGGGGGGGGGGW